MEKEEEKEKKEIQEKKQKKKRTMKASQIEQGYRILKYLQQNTDKDHPTTQTKMRGKDDSSDYWGYKSTFNDNIIRLSNALNRDKNRELRDEEEWSLVYEGLKEQCLMEEKRREAEACEDKDEEDDEEKSESEDEIVTKIGEIYYNHVFDYDEINTIIEGIHFSKTLTSDEVEALVKKVKKNLTSEFFKGAPKKICTIYEKSLVDHEYIRENLLAIQAAIENEQQIEFVFCKYNRKRKLIPSREKKDRVSPYYIMANAGKYYLLACKEFNRNNETTRKMSIWRIDMMKEIEIAYRKKSSNQPMSALSKKDVDNLPQTWDDSFLQSHINMSYDEPKMITLKIRNPEAVRKQKPTEADFTFLYDWFGDSFKYWYTDKAFPYDDYIKVKCSPFGMVNWALQYSDRVEVVGPPSVKDQVIKKIEALNGKYGVEKK